MTDEAQAKPKPQKKLSMVTLETRINEQEATIDRLTGTLTLLLDEMDGRQIIGGTTIKTMKKVLNGDDNGQSSSS